MPTSFNNDSDNYNNNYYYYYYYYFYYDYYNVHFAWLLGKGLELPSVNSDRFDGDKPPVICR